MHEARRCCDVQVVGRSKKQRRMTAATYTRLVALFLPHVQVSKTSSSHESEDNVVRGMTHE